MMFRLRVAYRSLKKARVSALIAALTLAIGIAATTTIFTIVSGLLIRPLPYNEPDRIVMVWSDNKQLGLERERMSFPELQEWRDSGIFESVVGFVPRMRTITWPGVPERVHGHEFTQGGLALLGTTPIIGRRFSVEEESRNGPNAVILGYSIWHRRYNGDPNVIGQVIAFDDVPFIVIGVMPPEFQFFNRQSDLIFPFTRDPLPFGSRRVLRVMARLKPDVNVRPVEAEAETFALTLARKNPSYSGGWTTHLVPLPVDASGDIRMPLLVLMGAALLVMLIACSNAASLLLVQINARARELALRLALGADRWHIVKQMLIESLLLTSVGTIPGVVLAYFAVQYFQGILPDRFGAGRYLIQLDRIEINPSLLAVVAVFVPLASIVVGLLPALTASRASLSDALKDSARGGSQGQSVRRLQKGLMVMQIATSVLLAIGAGLLLQTFSHLYAQGPGFTSTNVTSVSVQLPVFALKNVEPDDLQTWVRTNYDTIMSRMRVRPGVESVASVNDLPLSGFYWLNEFTIEGIAPRSAQSGPQAVDRYVSPSYFETLRIPVIKGRTFRDSDDTHQPLVVMVNDVFEQRYLRGESAIDRRVKAGRYDSKAPWHTIVGVVPSEKLVTIDENSQPIIYFSTTQNVRDAFNLLVRSRLPSVQAIAAVESELKSINPLIVPYAPLTLDSWVLGSTWRVRYSMMLLGGLAVVSLVMALAGVYGIMSYSVSQRDSEIGIRMALGSERREIMTLITREAVVLALFGIAIGIASAVVFTRILSTLLFGVGTTDLTTYATVAGLVLAISVLASVVPARRAAGVDPLIALRGR